MNKQMKRFDRFIVCVLMGIVSLTFFACSNDEDEAITQVTYEMGFSSIEDFCNLLDFCSRCIYRSDEGHRLLVGDGDVWHHEEEGWGDAILVQPLLDVG